MFANQSNSCKYNVAIALNNTAISLMKRQHYRSALAALGSAFTLIRCTSSTSHDADSKLCTVEDIHSPLQTASLCLAKASAVSSSPCTDVMSSGIELKVLEDTNRFKLLEQVLYMSATGTSVFVLRIDPVDELDANVHLDFLTILYNFGVAHRCYSLSKQRSNSNHAQHAKRYTKSAFQLLKGAYDVMSRGLSVIDETIDEEDDMTWSRTMLISTLALQNLMYLSYQLGNPEDAREFYNKLGDIRTMFGNLEIENMSDCQNLHAAAA
jgi:hypothetical protein